MAQDSYRCDSCSTTFFIEGPGRDEACYCPGCGRDEVQHLDILPIL